MNMMTPRREEYNRSYIYRIAFVATLGGFLFGYDTAIINGAILFIKRQFLLSDWQTEIVASSLLLGCVIGTALAGALGDRLARRRMLQISALLFAFSSLATALPSNIEQLCLFRFLAGVAIGIASVLSPLYIAEVSPAAIRGRLVSLNQFAIVSGILISYMAGWLFSSWGSESWRWMFASAILPSLLFFLALLTVPESPRWLIKEGRYQEAKDLFTRLENQQQAKLHLEEIRQVIAEESGTWSELMHPAVRRPLLIGIILAILQQVTGINTILYYGSILFTEQVGAQEASTALGANVLIGAINLIFTILAVAIIDRLGRKVLLILASGGMGVSLAILGLIFQISPHSSLLILSLILAYVAFFAIGQGPTVWVLLSELFPTKVRARAMAVATVCLWAACLLISLTFLSLVKSIGAGGAFWIYAAMCLITVGFVCLVVPETKGKRLEEIESAWFQNKKK